MKEQVFTIKNKYGIHAKPAAMFVQEASRYKSKILVSKDDVEINGKSIMGLMLLEAACGVKVKVKAEGPDESEAMAGLGRLFAEGFGEP